MRTAFFLSCFFAAAVRVYPESHAGSAARSTEFSRGTVTRIEPSLVSEPQVYEWLRVWQKRLDLKDWKIDAKIVRGRELPKGTVANINWSLSKRQATIRVLHSVDSNLSRNEIARDTELSVVHELVHLSMAQLPLDSTNTELEEEAVKKLSVALLNLQHRDAIETQDKLAKKQ